MSKQLPKIAFRLVSILLVMGMALSTAFAQPPKPVKPEVKPKVVPPAFKARLDATTLKLEAVDAIFSQVETKKLVTEADAEEVVRNLEGYARDMKALYDEALKEAEELGQSEGEKGSIATLKAFETTSKAHEKTLRGLGTRARVIENKVKDGVIKLDRPIFEKMSHAEREEFRKFLKPKGLREMEKLHPDIFIFKPIKGSGASLGDIKLAEVIDAYSGNLTGKVADFFVSPAEAAIAARCVSLAAAMKWKELVSCVLGAGPEAVSAYNAFKRCWAGAGKPWWVPKWAWRIKCLAVFVVKLA